MEWDTEGHYGITQQRAIELEGDTEYPRGSAAIFHFDKLTRQEQEVVIQYSRQELVEALAERKRIYQQAKEFAQLVNHDKYIIRGMNIHPYYKKQNRERIARLQARIKDLEARLK